MCNEHESNQGGPIGCSRDQIWSPGTRRGPPGPPKGAFRAKTGPFRPPGTQKGPDNRSKCVVTMNPTHTGQSGAVGTNSGPPGPPRSLKGNCFGKNGPFLPLFGSFFELGGSIWAITVLDEQNIPLRCPGLGLTDISGQNGPF